MDYEQGVSNFIEQLEDSGIIYVEWETTLFNRLGYPLTHDGSLFLLIPDASLPAVADLASDCGLEQATDETMPRCYACEFTGGVLRYHADDHPPMELARCRLVFVPLSWTGLNLSELSPMPCNGELTTPPRTPRSSPPLWVPRNTFTLSLPVATATLARILERSGKRYHKRAVLEDQLTSVLCYNLFDMSYEGDYMDIPGNDVPLSAEEVAEIDQAKADIRGWEMRPGEEHFKDKFISLLCGKQTSSAPDP